ncbi:MAG: hypothetical protein ACYDD7_17465, partial [Acidimicrobiales bacterium]
MTDPDANLDDRLRASLRRAAEAFESSASPGELRHEMQARLRWRRRRRAGSAAAAGTIAAAVLVWLIAGLGGASRTNVQTADPRPGSGP